MQGFDNHRKLIFWELTCWTIQVNEKLKKKKKAGRICYLTRVQPVTGGDIWAIEKQNQGGKVAEDGTQSKRESSSSFCLPKVYPVVYTPRRAAAPRAEGATLWSKINMWHIWLFSERERGPLKASSRRITHVPIFVLVHRIRIKDIGCYGNPSPPPHTHPPQHTHKHTHQHSPLAIVNWWALNDQNCTKTIMPANPVSFFFVRITADWPPLSVSNRCTCHWEGNTVIEHRSPLLKHTDL